MRVHGFTDILGIGAHLKSQDSFMNQLACILTANGSPNYPAGILGKKCLGRAGIGTGKQCPATGTPGKFALLIINFLFFGLFSSMENKSMVKAIQTCLILQQAESFHIVGNNV